MIGKPTAPTTHKPPPFRGVFCFRHGQANGTANRTGKGKEPPTGKPDRIAKGEQKPNRAGKFSRPLFTMFYKDYNRTKTEQN